MFRSVQLPTVTQPGGELSEPQAKASGPGLKSVSESLVVLQSLRQSRNRWLSSMFPKFSVKTRGGRATDVIPPPHTTKAHGKFDLHIGPHVFYDTAFYEVHYLPVIEPPPEDPQNTHASLASQPGSSGDSAVQASLASIPFPTGTYVTPALSTKVSAAAHTNPVLANLLKAVINRTATDDQVKTLGLLIQSLDGVRSLDQPGAASAGEAAVPVSPRSSSPRPFDVVLEFHERPSERFVFPRGDIVCELATPKAESAYRSSDMVIACSVPFPGAPVPEPTSQTANPPEVIVPEVVTFRLSRVSQALWELMYTWAGGPQKIEESRARLAGLARQAAPRVFLQHRIAEGELLEEIRSAVAPPYTLKPVKPPGADSNRSKRKSVSRRATRPPFVKRRSHKAKAPPPPPIACHSCGQTDVPLMMGGSKANAEIPQVQPARSHGTRPGTHVWNANLHDSTPGPSSSYAVQFVSETGTSTPTRSTTYQQQTQPYYRSPQPPGQ
ncbi:hypothetical protein C8Q77DRAFT_1214084 [Trametes polyzona]|nr:hypothetical protein C8Q77DRAFT_1214084 [Trametes polyzona]